MILFCFSRVSTLISALKEKKHHPKPRNTIMPFVNVHISYIPTYVITTILRSNKPCQSNTSTAFECVSSYIKRILSKKKSKTYNRYLSFVKMCLLMVFFTPYLNSIWMFFLIGDRTRKWLGGQKRDLGFKMSCFFMLFKHWAFKHVQMI